MTALELASLILEATQDDVVYASGPKGEADCCMLKCKDTQGRNFVVCVFDMDVGPGEEDNLQDCKG